MKEYRLKSWPELPVAYRRTGYRRLLNDLSQRHMGESDLRQSSGLSGQEVRSLLTYLDERDLLEVRETASVRRARWWSPRPLLSWVRRMV
jgi:hypothetical protein